MKEETKMDRQQIIARLKAAGLTELDVFRAALEGFTAFHGERDISAFGLGA